MLLNSFFNRNVVYFSLYAVLICSLITLMVKFVLLKKKLKAIKTENDILVQKYDGMRELKHNFSNFIQTLYGYVAIKDLNGIEKMCKDVCKETTNLSNQETVCLKSLNNPAIANLITTKCEYAKSRGIVFNIECRTNLNGINAPMYEVSKLLGVLLDNAIEGALKASEKMINMKISERRKAHKKVISIENSYDKSSVDINRIYNKGYTSKTDGKENHGIGLWSVKKVLENNRSINVKTNIGNTFCQKVELDFES